MDLENVPILSVGDRLMYKGRMGIVKFVGELPGKQGKFYGMDWRMPGHGRHNGSYKGVQYYETENQTSGTFIPVYDALICFGYDFLQAVRNRYAIGFQTDIQEVRHSYEMAMDSFKENSMFSLMSFVGFDLYNSQRFRVVNLNGCAVNGAGVMGAIETECPNIEELDLSSNLMKSWENVAEIGVQLKKLRLLTMTDCRMTIPANPEMYRDCFLELRELVLCRSRMAWNDMAKAAVMWPNLETLTASCNGISVLEHSDNFPNLKSLDLDGNPFDWDQVRNLGRLPKLEMLQVSETQISKISVGRDENLFPTLIELHITDNNVAKWEDFTDLNNLPAMTDLKFTRNPVARRLTVEQYHEQIIARIGKLKALNGSEITNEKRRLAESRYMDGLAEEWYSKCDDELSRNEFLKIHPRYMEFIEKFGQPLSVRQNVKDADAQKRVTVSLLDGKTGLTVEKILPMGMKLGNLEGIIRRNLHIAPNVKLRIIYESSRNEEMKVDVRDLACNKRETIMGKFTENGDTFRVFY